MNFAKAGWCSKRSLMGQRFLSVHSAILTLLNMKGFMATSFFLRWLVTINQSSVFCSEFLNSSLQCSNSEHDPRILRHTPLPLLSHYKLVNAPSDRSGCTCSSQGVLDVPRCEGGVSIRSPRAPHVEGSSLQTVRGPEEKHAFSVRASPSPDPPARSLRAPR